jgi:ATP adenylyltransferase/5',5'''-P-1,P-4-tetraphosphate phosphorylase II
MPPFEEGLYIDEIIESHRLVFNKFCVSDNHVLVVTKDFE